MGKLICGKISLHNRLSNLGKGNENYLYQLFYNLINNALTVAETPPQIDISVKGMHEYSEIHVTGNGIGIREKDNPQKF